MIRFYLDPSAATILISSISAVVIALGATGITYWRKAKKKVEETLKLDEKNKESDGELVVDDSFINDENK